MKFIPTETPGGNISENFLMHVLDLVQRLFYKRLCLSPFKSIVKIRLADSPKIKKMKSDEKKSKFTFSASLPIDHSKLKSCTKNEEDW